MGLVFHLEFIGVMQCKKHLKCTSNILIRPAYIKHILQKWSTALLFVPQLWNRSLDSCQNMTLCPIYWNHVCLTRPFSFLFLLNELNNIHWDMHTLVFKGKTGNQLSAYTVWKQKLISAIEQSFSLCVLHHSCWRILIFSHTFFCKIFTLCSLLETHFEGNNRNAKPLCLNSVLFTIVWLNTGLLNPLFLSEV